MMYSNSILLCLYPSVLFISHSSLVFLVFLIVLSSMDHIVSEINAMLLLLLYTGKFSLRYNVMMLECLLTDRRWRFDAGRPRSIAFIVIIRLVELSGRPLQVTTERSAKRASAG